MIDGVGDFLHHNLVVLLAVVYLPMKWVVVRVCGDVKAQAEIWLALPEELIYVALGLVLADVAASSGSFRRHFATSTHVTTDLFIVGVVNLFIATAVHRLTQWGKDHLDGWRAANEALRLRDEPPGLEQTGLAFAASEDNVLTIQVRHLAFFAISYALQLILVIFWVRWVAKVLAST